MEALQDDHDDALLSRDGHLTDLAAELYLLDELDEASRAIVEAHLAECEECQAYLRGLGSEAMAPVPLEELELRFGKLAPPPPQAGRRPRASAERSIWQRARPVALLAAAALAAVVVAVVLDPGSGDRQAPPLVEVTAGDRIKRAGNLGFELYVRDPAGSTRRVGTGDTVHPGDRVGFKLRSKVREGEVLIVGVDQAGEVYLGYPQHRGGASASLEEAVQDGDAWIVAPEEALEFDDVLGRERFVALRCPGELHLSKIRDSLKRAATKTAPEARLPQLLEGCQQREVGLVKVARPQ